jgi:hypothetical protein
MQEGHLIRSLGMRTGNRRLSLPAVLVLTALAFLLSIIGVFVQLAVSNSLVHWLIDGGVTAAVVLAGLGLSKRTT